MKKKVKSESSNTVNHAFVTAPTTPEDLQLNAELAAGDAPDPSIQYNAANQLKTLNNHIDNTFGADYSPETAAAMRYAGANQIQQNQGQMMEQDAFQRNQARFGKYLALRNARAPQLVTTGGTSTGTNTENSADFWNGVIGGGINFGLGVAKGKI